MSDLKYRHNVMNIGSIETFANVKGGCSNNTRDVYFVRGLGEPQNINAILEKVDRQMELEMSQNRIKYKRLSKLPQLRNIDEANYYSSSYDQLLSGTGLLLKNITVGIPFQQTLSNAINIVVDEYKKNKNGVSTSILKNFTVKLLYWLDTTVSELFTQLNEKSSIKVISDNVVKEQEYLFYQMLTYLGCDVFLIQNRFDVEAASDMLRFSLEIKMGEKGISAIEPYVKKEPEKQQKKVVSPSDINAEQQNKKVIIPERPGRTKQVSSASVPKTNTMADITQQTSTIPIKASTSIKEEKSFEELAQLASSVVLIAVHDMDGDIIGTGSGIMIGKNGFILTNNHVASGGRFYSVRIEDDEEVYTTTEVIKYNSITDLAVIRINRVLNPIPIYDGKKKLVRGQKVVAIGSPLGLFNSVSDGIISGFRNINDVDMIQFTAPISHGSSGGAVLNMYGEVIGISTAGIDSGQNINLAIGYENIRMFTTGFRS